MDYYFFGISLGPVTFFKNGFINKFYFLDFRGNNLVKCTYNARTGDILTLNSYTTDPNLTYKVSNGKRVIEFSAYLPHPPALDNKHKIGITNKKSEDEILFDIKDNNQFLFDTLLPIPKEGFNYYISSDVKNADSSIFKVFIEEVEINPQQAPKGN